jgi:hypothetical protein
MNGPYRGNEAFGRGQCGDSKTLPDHEDPQQPSNAPPSRPGRWNPPRRSRLDVGLYFGRITVFPLEVRLKRILLLVVVLAAIATACSETDAAETATTEPTPSTTTTTAAPTTTVPATTTTVPATTTTVPATTTTVADSGGIIPGEDADVDAVVLTYEIVFSSETGYEEKAPYIDDPEGLEQTVADYQETGESMGGVALAPKAVTIDGDTADVTYDLLFGGTPTYPDLSGDAVLIDETWKITREMFCAMMASARVGCPEA